LISDLIVIWRGWVLFQDQQWVLIGPAILWLGAFGTHLAYLILILTPSGYEAFSMGGSTNMILRAALSLSLATNAVTTLLIAYKLWAHRKLIVKNLGLSSRVSPAQRILILLVESGIIYCGFQATYLGLSHRSDADRFAVYTFADVYFALSAMYPTIVITMVNSQRSVAEVCGLSTPGSTKVEVSSPTHPDTRTATFGHLSFAAAARTTDETDSYFQTTRGQGTQDGQEVIDEKVVGILGKESPNRMV